MCGFIYSLSLMIRYCLQEKVLVGLDHAPHSFDVRSKILGPGGNNLQYISNETGATVTLRGRGSGFPEPNTGQESLEPLHLCVELVTVFVIYLFYSTICIDKVDFYSLGFRLIFVLCRKLF